MTNSTLTAALPGRVRGLLERYRNFLLYGVIGGGAVLVDLALYWLLQSMFGVPPIAANAISTGTALIYSFLVNSFVNFKVWNRILLRFLSFSLVSTCGFLVSTAMLLVFTESMGFDALLIKVLSLPVVLVVQFLLNSRITFATNQAGSQA